MQVAEAASHGLFWAILGALGGAGGLAAIYKLFLERKLPGANQQEVEARARLTNSDADSRDIDSSIKAAEVILTSAKKLAEYERKIAKLEVERDHYRDSFQMLERELEKFRHGGNGKVK